MKSKLNFLLTLFLTLPVLIAYHSVHGQTSPPSPNAVSTVSALGSYDVGLYSGRLNYSANIASFSSGKLKMPLSISYNSGGIKVQEIPGVVGLGWHLNIGGAITRYVNGLPDESTEGYCGPNRRGAENYYGQNKSYYENLLAGVTDGQPDKFYFSFLGYSGMFMLDADGQPVLQSSNGLKILYCPFSRANGRAVSGPEEWVIVDQSGNKFYFDVIEQSTTTIHGESSNRSFSYISTWYISKVITPDNLSISFGYNRGAPISYTNFSNVLHTIVGGSTNYYDNNVVTDIAYPAYLSDIYGSNVRLALTYDIRQDLQNAKALTKVELFNGLTLKTAYEFQYSYFISDDNSTKRLKLDAIVQKSSTSSAVHGLYAFGYNTSVNLPQRNSIQTDYLGLYNSNAGSSNISGYLGGDKSPDPIRSAANILTSVTNCYGGKTMFTYEQNDYGNNTHTATQQTKGLRIKKISSLINDTEVNSVTYQYNYPGTVYSSGINLGEEANYSYTFWDTHTYSESLKSVFDLSGYNVGYSFVTVNNLDGTSVQYQFTDAQTYPDHADYTYYYTPSLDEETQSSSEAGMLFGPVENKTSLAYARGKMLSEKYFDASHILTKTVTNSYSLSAPIGDVIGVDVVPGYFITVYNGALIYGLGWYNRSVSHFYTQDLQLISRSETADGVATNYTFAYSNSAPNLLSGQTRTLSNGNLEKIVYRYPFDVLTNTVSGGPNSGYPLNYLVKNNIIGQPLETIKSIISGGVETITSVDLTKYLGTSSGLVKPYQQYRLNASQTLLSSNYSQYHVLTLSGGESGSIDTHLEPTKTFSDYDAFGNLRTTTNPYSDDSETTLIWGYGGEYPTVQLTNATANEVYSQNFEDNNILNVIKGGAHTGSYYYSGNSFTVNWTKPNSREYVISYWYKIAGEWRFSGIQPYSGPSITLTSGEAYDDILIYPSDSLIKTSTYEPGSGMTSATDTKGQTTYYEYDEFNRLGTVRDRYGNITKSHVYHTTGF